MKEGKYNYPVSRRSCLHFLLLSFALAGCKRDAPADARPWSEEVWEKVDAGTRAVMTDMFLKSMQYEYAFWDYWYYGDGKDYSYVR